MALDADEVRTITNNIEATYQSLRRAGSGLAGLVSAGRATCAEVKAYNLWALAAYNAQRGMLTSLRAAGEKNVPALPTAPVLFVWKGISGSDAWKIDCGSPVSGLMDAMDRAMAGPRDPADVAYLSSDQLSIWTQDPEGFNPGAAPSLAQLDAGLGLAPFVWVILICGISLSIYVGIPALMAYLEENSIQEETTARMAVSAQAFSTYIDARSRCLSDCLNRGGSMSDCTSQCQKLVPPPNLIIDAARKPLSLGFWATIGLVTVAVAGGAIAFRYWRTRQPETAAA